MIIQRVKGVLQVFVQGNYSQIQSLVVTLVLRVMGVLQAFQVNHSQKLSLVVILVMILVMILVLKGVLQALLQVLKLSLRKHCLQLLALNSLYEVRKLVVFSFPGIEPHDEPQILNFYRR